MTGHVVFFIIDVLELLQTSIAGGLSTKWRLAMARRWLLRSLHWLLGPVFLRPLGLQDEEPLEAGGEGIEDSSTVGAKATVAGESVRTFISDLLFTIQHKKGVRMGDTSKLFDV